MRSRFKGGRATCASGFAALGSPATSGLVIGDTVDMITTTAATTVIKLSEAFVSITEQDKLINENHVTCIKYSIIYHNPS